MYIDNDGGCYTIEGRVKDKPFCFDATRKYHQVGRYMNHSTTPNVKVNRPMCVRGKWRLAMTALREIQEGEELMWHYGDRSSSLDWMKGKGKGKKRPASGDIEPPKAKRRIIISDKEDDNDPPRKSSQERYRKPQYCPVPGCFSSKPLKKLSETTPLPHPRAACSLSQGS